MERCSCLLTGVLLLMLVVTFVTHKVMPLHLLSFPLVLENLLKRHCRPFLRPHHEFSMGVGEQVGVKVLEHNLICNPLQAKPLEVELTDLHNAHHRAFVRLDPLRQRFRTALLHVLLDRFVDSEFRTRELSQVNLLRVRLHFLPDDVNVHNLPLLELLLGQIGRVVRNLLAPSIRNVHGLANEPEVLAHPRDRVRCDRVRPLVDRLLMEVQVLVRYRPAHGGRDTRFEVIYFVRFLEVFAVWTWVTFAVHDFDSLANLALLLARQFVHHVCLAHGVLPECEWHDDPVLHYPSVIHSYFAELGLSDALHAHLKNSENRSEAFESEPFNCQKMTKSSIGFTERTPIADHEWNTRIADG